jgi:hypothetical protein
MSLEEIIEINKKKPPCFDSRYTYVFNIHTRQVDWRMSLNAFWRVLNFISGVKEK